MTQRRSKFASMLDAANEQQPEAAPAPAPRAAPAAARHTRRLPDDTEPGQRGRPRTGKRSDPDYEQTTAYVRRDSYRDVKIALLQEGSSRDYSDLIEELLDRWLAGRRAE